MQVLVACEYSGRVRDAFLNRGHDAVSCDLLATESPGGPHIQGDVSSLLNKGWDMMIAFPPCQYLTNSNAWRWAEIEKEREQALAFVWRLLDAPIERIAIENPVGAISTNIRPADQYIQPWQFGDPYQKKTGLWLKNLAPLKPDIADKPVGVTPWIDARYVNRPKRGHRNSKKRSLTFLGIARAMAQQWG